MGNMFIISFFILFSFNLSAQTAGVPQEATQPAEIVSHSEFEGLQPEVFEGHQNFQVLKKIEPISADPYDQNKMINYQKSKDIISIKAYMRALQIKGKVTRMS